jgi:hypothetical protein
MTETSAWPALEKGELDAGHKRSQHGAQKLIAPFDGGSISWPHNRFARISES